MSTLLIFCIGLLVGIVIGAVLAASSILAIGKTDHDRI